MSKNKNIPRLRFPGFSGGWIGKNLGEVTTYTKGFAFKSEDYTGEGIRIIRVSDLDEDTIKIDNNKVFISIGKKALYSNYVLCKNDIIITTVGSKPELRESAVGRGIYVDRDNYGLLNQNMLKLNNSLNVNNRFIFSYINTDEYISYITSIQRGNANQSNIAITDLFKYRIFITSLDEQEKIAECLSSVDELITAQTDKIAALKEHKKGLMQKLFPQDGETLPRFRFPEFHNSAPWSWVNGNILFSQVSNKEHNSDLPILAITQEYGAVPREMIDYKISVTDKSIESYKVVEVGDFIISLRSFQGGIEYSSYKGICSPAYIILRKKVDLNNLFFKYHLKSFEFIQKLNKNLEGIRDGKMVSYNQFSEVLLPFPHILEQQKIVECLSSLDELILLHTEKLSVLKDHKKGLMQQLFPAAEKE
jgi:type I restriction enzyme S subunit